MLGGSVHSKRETNMPISVTLEGIITIKLDFEFYSEINIERFV